MGSDNLSYKKREHSESQLRRKRASRKPNELILIVCEGEKTEPHYFRALRDFYKIHTATIKIEPSKNPSPTNVVSYAKKLSKNGEYDIIYCVFDMDRHADFEKAKSLAEKSSFIAIDSNPCFEYWILLHFTYMTKIFGGSASPCEALVKELKKHIKDYEKNYKKFDKIIKGNLDIAIDNAKKANEESQKQNYQTPYTKIVEIVEKFMELAKNSVA